MKRLSLIDFMRLAAVWGGSFLFILIPWFAMLWEALLRGERVTLAMVWDVA